jgi:hypothetical protein
MHRENVAQSIWQARSNAEERQLKLVGYYQASHRPDDERVLIPVGEKVASVVHNSFDHAFAIVVRFNSNKYGLAHPIILT